MSTEDDTFEALKYRIGSSTSGGKVYYNAQNLRHRLEGPAYVGIEGQAWWVNGILHRVDGPAVVYADGHFAWYIDGYKLTEANFLDHPLCKIKA